MFPLVNGKGPTTSNTTQYNTREGRRETENIKFKYIKSTHHSLRSRTRSLSHFIISFSSLILLLSIWFHFIYLFIYYLALALALALAISADAPFYLGWAQMQRMNCVTCHVHIEDQIQKK
jgi:hypothetical protein